MSWKWERTESRLCHICDCASLDRAVPLSSLSPPERLRRETFRISGRTRRVEIQIELNVVWQDRSNAPAAPHRATREKTFLSHLPRPSTINFVLRALQVSPPPHENYLGSRAPRSSSLQQKKKRRSDEKLDLPASISNHDYDITS